VAKSKSKGPQQKQRANVYTMMLIAAFIALCLGSAILYMHMERYNWEKEAKQPPAASLLTPAGTAEARVSV
jgi:hypothetical protein